MKTSFGRPPDDDIAAVSRGHVHDTRGFGRDLVLGLVPGVAVPSLSDDEHKLLGLIDGRLSVARLARMSGLSEAVLGGCVARLLAHGLVVPVAPNVVTIEGRKGEPVYRLGNYDIGARLGRGGMGDVYVSRRNGASGFRRLFALKVVRQEADQASLALQSFVRELKVGQLLQHPNVQSVVDVGMHNERPFLVLDYVEGTDLEELLSVVGGPLDPTVVVAVLVDLLRGLQRAHDMVDEQGRWLGLVHGDVSLSNILIGVDGVTRLADFGSARFAAAGETGRADSETAGKPAYMAPEQLRRETLDAGADMFAAGVVMWTALTGQELFLAPTYEQTVRNVHHKEIVPPSTYGAPPCLDDICMRALSRERRWRCAVADEFAAELLRVAVPNGLLASPTRVGQYVRHQLGEALVERHRQIQAGFHGGQRPTPATAGVAVSGEASAVPALSRKQVAPTIVLPATQPANAPTAATAPSRPRLPWNRWFGRRTRSFMLGLLAALLVAVAVGIAGGLAMNEIRPRHLHRPAVKSQPAVNVAAPS